MKTKFIIIVMIMLTGSLVTNAQTGFQRRTIEERVKRVVDTITTELKLDKAQQVSADSIFTSYYKAMDKLRESFQQGERPDRSVFEKIMAERDEKLKKFFSEAQFKKFKEEIEPAMRPQRRQGN